MAELSRAIEEFCLILSWYVLSFEGNQITEYEVRGMRLGKKGLSILFAGWNAEDPILITAVVLTVVMDCGKRLSDKG